MAITGAIPLPNTGMSEFLKQLQLGQQNRFKSQELGQNQAYQQGSLNIQKMAQERANKQLPYLLRQYEDMHGKAASDAQQNKILNDLLNHHLNNMMPEMNQQNQNFGQIPQEQQQGNPSPSFQPSQPGQPLQHGEADEPGTAPINAPNSSYKKLEQQGAIPSSQPQGQSTQPQQDLTKLPPFVRSFLKSKGFDVDYKSPEELSEIKLKNALAVKGFQVPGTSALTKPTITANQKVIQNIDNLLPQLSELIESHSPGQLVGKYLHPNKQASYEAKIGLLADSFLGALGLPKTDQSLHLAKDIVSQRQFESHDAYIERLKGIQADLAARRKRATRVLGGESNFSGEPTAGNSPAEAKLELTYNIETGEFE